MKKWLGSWILCAFAVPAAAQAVGETEWRAQVTAEIRAAFAKEDFGAIEARYKRAVANDERSQSGLHVSNRIVRAFQLELAPPLFESGRLVPGQLGRDDYWRVHREKAMRWRQQMPESVLSAMVLATIHARQAWQYRGQGFANTVSEEGWKGFHRHQKASVDALQAVRLAGMKDPNWRWSMLNSLAQQDVDQYKALVKDSLAAFPQSYDLYFVVANYMLPQWGGSMEQISEFADYAVERTRAKDGNALYARIFWGIEYGLPNGYLKNSSPTWTKVRAGFEDLIRQYPAAWNMNAYARMACAAEDKVALKSILQRIGEHIDVASWDNRAHYVNCRQLAAAS
jgi:hypothetical protein